MTQRPQTLSSLLYAKAFYAVLLLQCLGILFSGFFLDDIWAWSLGLLYVAYDTSLLIFIFYKTFRLQPQLGVQTALPSIGVIIPARNEASIISACLDALLVQGGVIQSIIVADDGSTDHSPALLRTVYGVPEGMGLQQSLTHRTLHVLRLEHQGKACALNAAWPLIDADIVVTLDADTIVAADAIAALATAFAQDPHLAAAGGVLKPRCAPRWSSRFFEFSQHFEYIYSFIARAAWMNSRALLLVSGAFAAYRRDVLQQLNGFDPHSMVEDYEINHRLYRYAYEHNTNWSIGVVAGAYAVTDTPANMTNFFHQRRRWFAGFLQTQFANLDMTANSKFGVIGRFMLPLKAFDTIQPLIGAAALGVLMGLIVMQSSILRVVFSIILAKLIIDLLFNLWGLYLYHRWINQRLTAQQWPQALIYTLLTPFGFQWLRHIGACLGWWSYLTKKLHWTAQRND